MILVMDYLTEEKSSNTVKFFGVIFVLLDAVGRLEPEDSQ